VGPRYLAVMYDRGKAAEKRVALGIPDFQSDDLDSIA
jgi:hypothetical protein